MYLWADIFGNQLEDHFFLNDNFTKEIYLQ